MPDTTTIYYPVFDPSVDKLIANSFAGGPRVKRDAKDPAGIRCTPNFEADLRIYKCIHNIAESLNALIFNGDDFLRPDGESAFD